MSYQKVKTKNGERQFFRFTLHQRAQHITLFSCIILLSLTGFPLKFSDSSWAPQVYNFFGGIYIAKVIHRVTGFILTGLFIYHTGTLVYGYMQVLKALREKGEYSLRNAIKAFLDMEMIPKKRDITDFIQHILYLLYLRKEKPHYERMSWKEKFDYFAPYWGIPIVAGAGMVLIFREEASHLFPGLIYNAAYIMHTDEVLLAAMYLSCVHWYNVHYSPEKFPMATVFLTGYLSEEEMIDEHSGEYERVMEEEGLKGQTKSHAEVSSKGLLEKGLYTFYIFVIMGFVIWYWAFSTRLIFHSHGSEGGEAVAAVIRADKDAREIATTTSFHSRSAAADTDSAGRCTPCHTEFPHSESKDGMEPFLNMHASYIACETCHMKLEGQVVVRWYDMKTGAHFESLPVEALAGRVEKGSYGAKIISGVDRDGKFVPVWEQPESVTGDLQNKRNHSTLSKEPLKCTDCHNKEKGYIQLASIGYPQSRIDEIAGDEKAALIGKYQKMFEEVSE